MATKQTRRALIGLILSLIVYVEFAYCYALVKPMWCDEIWTIKPVMNIWNHYPTGTVVQWFPVLSYHMLIGWFELWGGYTLLGMRLHTVLWGVVLLVGLYELGKRHGSWVGVWAVLLCALDYNFLFCSDSRPDIICAAFGIWALVTRNSWLASGAVLIHPFGWVYLILVFWMNRRIDWGVLGFIIGMLILFVVWIPAKDVFSQASKNVRKQVLEHVSGNLAQIGRALVEGYGFGFRLILLGTYVWATAKTILDRKELWWLGVPVMAAFFLNDCVTYLPHAIPICALCVAIQMKRFPVLTSVMFLDIIFSVKGLMSLWDWNGISNL